MANGNGIVWEDPPPPSSHYGKWSARLAPLILRPGEWANVGEHAAGMAHQLRLNACKPGPGRWEFTQRSIPGSPKRALLYARYLGPAE